MSYESLAVNRVSASKYYDYREAFLLRYMERVNRHTEFSRMFRDLLTSKRLSGAAFARLVGCSRAWPSNIEHGRQRGPADLATLEKWATALELNEQQRWRFIGLAGLDHAPPWFVKWYWSSGKHL